MLPLPFAIALKKLRAHAALRGSESLDLPLFLSLYLSLKRCFSFPPSAIFALARIQTNTPCAGGVLLCAVYNALRRFLSVLRDVDLVDFLWAAATDCSFLQKRRSPGSPSATSWLCNTGQEVMMCGAASRDGWRFESENNNYEKRNYTPGLVAQDHLFRILKRSSSPFNSNELTNGGKWSLSSPFLPISSTFYLLGGCGQPVCFHIILMSYDTAAFFFFFNFHSTCYSIACAHRLKLKLQNIQLNVFPKKHVCALDCF